MFLRFPLKIGHSPIILSPTLSSLWQRQRRTVHRQVIPENDVYLKIRAVQPAPRRQNIACDTEFNLAEETLGIEKVFQPFIHKAETEN
jgi:hypothetical protein